MHKQDFVLENYMQKILWDFEIETDHLIPFRRPGLAIVNKIEENLPNTGFCRLDGPQIEY